VVFKNDTYIIKPKNPKKKSVWDKPKLIYFF
jgi:hypothetical protein